MGPAGRCRRVALRPKPGDGPLNATPENPTKTPHATEKRCKTTNNREQRKCCHTRLFREALGQGAAPIRLDTAEVTGSIPVAPTRRKPLPGLRNAVTARAFPKFRFSIEGTPVHPETTAQTGFCAPRVAQTLQLNSSVGQTSGHMPPVVASSDLRIVGGWCRFYQGHGRPIPHLRSPLVCSGSASIRRPDLVHRRADGGQR
jgi:hypothetical protein